MMLWSAVTSTANFAIDLQFPDLDSLLSKVENRTS
jgi:hypothetical protein